MSDWFSEFLVVLGYSTRTQLALVCGALFFVGILLTGKVLVGGLELPGSLMPVTEVVRDGLMQRYDRLAWSALGGFLLLAVKTYRKDRRKILGI
jgi:hypothetical protein